MCRGEQIVAELLSRSSFPKGSLDMHGLISETSIYVRQNQPGASSSSPLPAELPPPAVKRPAAPRHPPAPPCPRLLLRPLTALRRRRWPCRFPRQKKETEGATDAQDKKHKKTKSTKLAAHCRSIDQECHGASSTSQIRSNKYPLCY